MAWDGQGLQRLELSNRKVWSFVRVLTLTTMDNEERIKQAWLKADREQLHPYAGLVRAFDYPMTIKQLMPVSTALHIHLAREEGEGTAQERVVALALCEVQRGGPQPEQEIRFVVVGKDEVVDIVASGEGVPDQNWDLAEA
jgi:hypothetical protein